MIKSLQGVCNVPEHLEAVDFVHPLVLEQHHQHLWHITYKFELFHVRQKKLVFAIFVFRLTL
jgi:hypothetical protein